MSYVKRFDLNKNHGLRRDSCLIARSKLFGCFHAASNTAGTQHLANLTTVFENRHLLQIGSKFSIGRSLRKTAIMTKCRGFSTIFAFCHDKDPFNYACLELAGFRTAQQARILPYPETFYKNCVL
jgi:hypothetical protein